MEFIGFIIFFTILGLLISLIGTIYEKTVALHKHLNENNLYGEIVFFILLLFSPLLLSSRDGFLQFLGVIGSILLIKYLYKILKYFKFYLELILLKHRKSHKHIKYDVAFSFSGEDRPIVKKIANHLTKNGHKVFFDDYQKSNLWGRDLHNYLSDIYKNKSKFVVLIISKEYKRKMWTNHELRSAQARDIEENYDYILPIRIDDTEIGGLLHTTAYLDLRRQSLAEICHILNEKIIGKNNPIHLDSTETETYNFYGNKIEKENENVNQIKVTNTFKKIKFYDNLAHTTFSMHIMIIILFLFILDTKNQLIAMLIFFLITYILSRSLIRLLFRTSLKRKIKSTNFSENELLVLNRKIRRSSWDNSFIKEKSILLINENLK